MARLGLPEPVEISAAEAMIWMVSAKYAEVLWLRAMVGSIPQDDLVFGVSRERTGGDASSGVTAPKGEAGSSPGAGLERTFEARPNIWWQMLRTGEDQLVRYAAAARAAGCDEARVRLAESQGEILVQVMRAALVAMFKVVVDTLTAAGVSDVQVVIVALQVAWEAAVSEVVPREFRRLGEGIGE
jgi:hypothetical protein